MVYMYVCFLKANSCWEIPGLQDIIRVLLQNAINFFDMLFDLFDRLQTQQKLLVAMTLWSIWKSQDTELWDAINTSPATIVTRAKGTLNKLSCMQRAKTPVQNDDFEHTRTKPPLSMIKCNVDPASFNSNTTKHIILLPLPPFWKLKL